MGQLSVNWDKNRKPCSGARNAGNAEQLNRTKIKQKIKQDSHRKIIHLILFVFFWVVGKMRWRSKNSEINVVFFLFKRVDG